MVSGRRASFGPEPVGPLEAQGLLGSPEPEEPLLACASGVGMCRAGVEHTPDLAGPLSTLSSTVSFCLQTFSGCEVRWDPGEQGGHLLWSVQA